MDEQKFNELSDEDFLDMRSRGLVALVYAHLTSLQQLRRISERQYVADKAAEATQSDEQAEHTNPESYYASTPQPDSFSSTLTNPFPGS